MAAEQKKLSFWEKAGYGCGDFASVLFWQTIMVYLFFFYTDVFGLTAAAAGTMMGVSRLLDAFFDVGIGMTADRTSTRWGKFRPYLLWMAIPLAVAAVITFITPGFGPAGKLVYAYATFILFMFFYSAINIPYTSLLGVISSDPSERTSASSFKFVGAYLAGMIVSISALPLAKALGGGVPSKGWPITMTIYAVAAVLFFMITFASTKERIQPMVKEKMSIRSDLKDLFKNVPWMILFAVTILFILFVCIRLAVTTHYFKYYVGEQRVEFLGKTFGFEWLTSAFNTVGQAFSLIGVLLVPWFTRVARKKRAVLILFATAMICTGAFIFLKPDQLPLIFGFQVVGSLTGGPISAVLWAMYADTADYSEWKTGRRATGLVYSASIMSNKIGWAVGTAIAGFILGAYGFKPDVVQNANVLLGLKSMMSILPVAAGFIAFILLAFFYKLDDDVMKKIKHDLEAKRSRKAAPDRKRMAKKTAPKKRAKKAPISAKKSVAIRRGGSKPVARKRIK
jgi:glycoside/pentoside/hexuronide:cation symporter, GPH family